MDFWGYQSKHSKRLIDKSSLQISICCLLQAKHLVIAQEKNEELKMVLSYCLQQHVSVKLHDLINEAISFAIGRGWHRQLI